MITLPAGLTITPEDVEAFQDCVTLLLFPATHDLPEKRKFKALDFARKVDNKADEIKKMTETWRKQSG